MRHSSLSVQTGGNAGYDNRGLIPRSLSYVFQQAQRYMEEFGDDMTVRVSYLEIYNESLYDLLRFEDAKHSDLQIFEDKQGVTHVKGLSMPIVTNEADALNLLFEGETNRAIAEHQLNQASTRSGGLDFAVVRSHS